MRFSRVLSSFAAAAACASCIPLAVEAQPKPLPYDARGQDLSVATLDSKFMLHIFNQRKSGAGDPADYVTVDQTGRSPAYNDDTGVIGIGVDENAIFNGQTNFRRSELVQSIAGESGGTTFFRASLMTEEALQNKYTWQVVFPESHLWEVYVDATQDPPSLQFRTDGSKVQWETEFKTGTWYNFGIAVAGSGITMYTSEGGAALVETFTDAKSATPPSDYEFHFGLLTFSQTDNPPMVANHQDILYFNGVSVDTEVVLDGASGEPAPAPAPKPTTSAPEPSTSAPEPTTSAPKPTPAPEPTTSAPKPTPAPAPAKCLRKRS